MRDADRDRVLDPIDDIVAPTPHLEGEGAIGAAATIAVERAEPASKFVPHEKQSAWQGRGQLRHRLNGGVGDADARTRRHLLHIGLGRQWRRLLPVLYGGLDV